MAECVGKDLGDLGHGVSAELRYVDGILVGMDWRHPCVWRNGTRNPESYSHIPLRPYWPDGWDVLSVDPLTLASSLLCTFCRFHGSIRDGRWVPA